ncbi:MAG: sigma-70 family RNA polymerase sigma factor [Clostridia bacterium]|nr:sigma-70 family RNA polymerase sigma factor [Clostridia bacterium]
MENIKETVHIDFVKLKENKSEYFEKFYSNNYKLVYRICFSILKNAENSEDVSQIVFEKILKMREDQYPSEYESSWMYTVVKNECLQLIRKTKINENEEELENTKSNENEIENIIDDESYNKLVKKLNKKQEQIVSLKVISEFTFKEIGQIMSMPIATVQWYYYSSIKSLKAAISNLAMFIITLIIGLKYINTDNKEIKEEKANRSVENDDVTNSENEEGSSNIHSSSESKSNKSRNIDSIISSTEPETTTDSSNVEQSNINIGIMSICGIFLALTIIFSIIFIKHQQKVNKKTSKK